MESYHLAWLTAHPERTEQWLKDRVADGFHIHHMDGDHANDAPINLVLIESGDHMMIHNGVKRMLWKPSVRGARPKESNNAKATRLAVKLNAMREKVIAHDEAEARKIERARRIKLRDASRARYAEARAAGAA